MWNDELRVAQGRYLKAKDYGKALQCVKALYEDEKDREYVHIKLVW